VPEVEIPLLAIVLPRPAAARAVAAAWDRGEAVAPLDPQAPAAELRRVLAALRPTLLEDRDGRARRAGGGPAADGVAAVVATSGTSGAPKLVELTAAGIRASALTVSRALDSGPDDAWLCCVPVHHVAGLGILARAWHAGVPVTVHERFEVDAVRHRGGATLVSLVPTMLARLLEARVDLSGFRRVLLGGAPVPPALRRRATAAGARVVSTYGLTETFGGVVHDGLPLPGVEVRVDGGDGRGEILLRGPMVMRGYRGDPERTAAVLRDGWLATGDLGRLGPDGRLAVLGRSDDLIISGGLNVHPAEVEAVLAGHPAVADVAVCGAPDAEWGQRVVAYVVPRDPHAPPRLEQLRGFAHERLAAAKAPRQLILVDQVPRSPSGKLLRRLLPNRHPDP
jgi:O-succinylbenzoic acid--CoA ligase